MTIGVRRLGRIGHVICTYASLAARVLTSAPTLGPVRLIAVDGPAGSGKTTFAARLADALGQAPVVHTDDLLEGWTDLATYWPRLEAWVLAPLRCGKPGRYRRYDWDTEAFAEWHDVDVAPVLIVEGVGSARSEAVPNLTLAVWVKAPRKLRLARGLDRDGEELRPQWARWMADEDAHYLSDRTALRADVHVDGDPSVPHDPATQFVTLDPP